MSPCCAPSCRRRSMARRPPEPEANTTTKTWSKRLAWGVLVAGGTLVVLRVAFATVVRVHGDGMAPTLVDGEHMLLVRGTWTIERGDVVVYATNLPAPVSPATATPPEQDAPRSRRDDGRDLPDARRTPARDLRNTAVVDPEELGEALDENWRRVQERADVGIGAVQAYRVGRVLAMPGDEVTFLDAHDGLGLVVEGQPIERKESSPVSVALRDATKGAGPRRALWEQGGERRYLVLDSGRTLVDWRRLMHDHAVMGEPFVAPGYLVLADNRDEGRCCDSRMLGWIDAEALRGEVLVRLGGGPQVADDEDAPARGFQWKP